MRKLWIAFGLVVLVSFAVLGWVGVRIYQQAPPIPRQVVTNDRDAVVPEGEIAEGQNVWRSMGGMEVGSIWGHGSYVAPDWTADYLHREAVFILDTWARTDFGSDYAALDGERQSQLQHRLATLMRRNTYDASTGELVVPPVRALAFAANLAHYSDVFANGRKEYAIPAGAQADPVKLRQLTAFFFWSAWAASTNRPGDTISYTSNWPHEPLVDNRPTTDAIVWTGVSVIVLLAGIGLMAWWYASREPEAIDGNVPANDPLLGGIPTPSQRAVVKYFWVVSGLILLQIVLGSVAAHYGVEGDAFYGLRIADLLPYSVARTWHTQLGIFWIATAWLAAGLYIAPVIGAEPKYQVLGVNVLFGALLVVVLGSMAGEWLSVKQVLGSGTAWYYFGHSGYEYIDLGKFFQVALLAGLFIWLFLMVRGIRPALSRRDEQRPIVTLFLISTIAIAGFYGAALGAGRHTNLAVAEYWRWWVVHLWVEGFFEVFATVVIAFLFAKLRLVNLRTAAEASIGGATIYLAGGIIGTAHHLYFAGTPTIALALGSVFSALEVVPLLFVGYEAWHNLRRSRAKEWVQAYRWPINCFIAVAFWNMLGAGLFGFMINPPVALYYMQGLNTTPVHGHAALFGVYGMLGIGLMLFCLRALRPAAEWNDGQIRFAFWTINGGLLLMVTLSLLPVGLMQTWASVHYGYWYARSPEFLQGSTLQTLRWLRIIGDTIFAVGVVTLVVFVLSLARRSTRVREVPAGATIGA